VYVKSGVVRQLLNNKELASTLLGRTPSVAKENPASVIGDPEMLVKAMMPPWLWVNTMFPALLTLALTKGTFAALTAATNAAGPVPFKVVSIVASPLFRTSLPAKLAKILKLVALTNGPGVVVLPAIIVAPIAIL
jgi:hypothetical protein